VPTWFASSELHDQFIADPQHRRNYPMNGVAALI
jgi:hypothetical protein